MEKERIVLLKGEVKGQIGIIDEIYEEIEKRIERMEESQENLESLAYHLHNLYCAFEDMFEMIADFFENNIDEKVRYHQKLLLRMSVEIEGVRTAVISKGVWKLLDNLRAFRHLFRHAYGYRLDSRKMRIVVEDALRLKEIYKKEIKGFLEEICSNRSTAEVTERMEE